MMRSKTYYAIPAVLLLVIGAVIGMTLDSAMSGPDTFRYLQKLQDAFLIINKQYVDEVNPKKEVEAAIDGMLRQLDPHSSYISAEEIKEVQESYEGSFGGVGILFEQSGDTAKVVSVVNDGPSQRAGVMGGDRIVMINDSSAVALPDGGIQDRLKGPIGTKVKMSVLRHGVNKPIDFIITRGRIPLYSVDSAYMVDDKTGFIRIDRFAATTYNEFVDKVKELNSQGMQRLILDLRDDPGGIMESAIRIADEMLKGGKTIVYTKGRVSDMDEVYRSTDGGILESEPIIVLVSPMSASASEILAGALQDQDRALIVGQRTFGKGLVQRQFPLPDGSVLQMTVARYYTPSGRLIQTPYENGNLDAYYKEKFADYQETFNVSEYAEHIPDSLKYKTAKGRVVFGGGGILPDYLIKPDTTSPFWSVVGRGLDFNFIRDYFVDNEYSLRDQWGKSREGFIANYQVSNDTWKDFVSYVATQEAKNRQADSTNQASSGDENASALVKATHAHGKTQYVSTAELEAMKPRVETLLKARLGQQIFGSKVWHPIYNKIDPEVQRALRLWDSAEDLAGLSGEQG
ncbi:MAG TPA: S41 family peptidase [Rhodothermales bacterium]|nr:S41 family peptidase [Rhodothermales bacterium]